MNEQATEADEAFAELKDSMEVAWERYGDLPDDHPESSRAFHVAPHLTAVYAQVAEQRAARATIVAGMPGAARSGEGE